jgi:hypothetical protein
MKELDGLQSFDQNLWSLADSLVCLTGHSKAFLLSSPPPTLSMQLLQELQQQMHLHMMLPSAPLLWMLDRPISSSSFYCAHACSTACRLIDYHHQVLQDGPASFYEHITGQKRSQAKSQKQKSGRLASAQAATVHHTSHAGLPADLLLLLDQLVQRLMKSWAASLGIQKSKKDSQPSAASTTDTAGRTDTGASGTATGQSSDSGANISRCFLQMPASVSTVGTLALKIAEGFNIL